MLIEGEKHILIFVGALYALGLGSFLLWVGELGLARYPSRTLLKGPSMYKTSIPKERQQIMTNTYT